MMATEQLRASKQHVTMMIFIQLNLDNQKDLRRTKVVPLINTIQSRGLSGGQRHFEVDPCQLSRQLVYEVSRISRFDCICIYAHLRGCFRSCLKVASDGPLRTVSFYSFTISCSAHHIVQYLVYDEYNCMWPDVRSLLLSMVKFFQEASHALGLSRCPLCFRVLRMPPVL